MLVPALCERVQNLNSAITEVTFISACDGEVVAARCGRDEHVGKAALAPLIPMPGTQKSSPVGDFGTDLKQLASFRKVGFKPGFQAGVGLESETVAHLFDRDYADYRPLAVFGPIQNTRIGFRLNQLAQNIGVDKVVQTLAFLERIVSFGAVPVGQF